MVQLELVTDTEYPEAFADTEGTVWMLSLLVLVVAFFLCQNFLSVSPENEIFNIIPSVAPEYIIFSFLSYLNVSREV